MNIDSKMIRKLNLKYSLVHGAYWMVFGATYNFVTVYLLSKNFSSQNIGIIVALTNIFSAIAQPYVAGIADRTTKFSLRGLASLLLFISLSLSVLLLVAPKTMVITAVLYFLILTVMLTTQPLLNAMGMGLIGHGVPLNFGLARGMGSISYAFMSYVLGAAVDQQGASVLPYAFIALFGLSFFFTFTFTIPKMLSAQIEANTATEEEKNLEDPPTSHLSTLGFMKTYKRFNVYLLGIIFIFISFNIINIYMIKIVENVGGNESTMGTAFAIAAILELPVMLSFSKLSRRFQVGNLLKISGLFFTLKALLTFIAPTIFMVYVAQGVQMVSYAIFVPGSIYYVNQVIYKRDLVKGQAFTTAAMTLGGVGGSLVGGFLLTQSTLSTTLLTGTFISVVGTVLFLVSIESKKRI